MTVQGAIQLSHPTAVAWRALDASANAHLHRNISIAAPAGGYRTFAVQAQMRQVFLHGTRLQKISWGLSLTSTATPAEEGFSNHGLGVCVDIVGTPMDSAFLNLARKYGFTRPLRTDPNHFIHDGKTAVDGTPPIDFKQLAHYLNGKKLGKRTSTEEDGEPGKVFWWMLQALGHRDGLYNLKVDGDPGAADSRTRWLAHHYWEKIR